MRGKLVSPPMAFRFCPYCGSSLIPNSLRCDACGRTLPGGEPRACAKCGTTLIPGAAFCATCGAPTSASIPSAGPTAAPSALPRGGPGRVELPRDAGSTPASTDADRRALANVSSAAMLGIAGFVLSIVGVALSVSIAYFGTLETHYWNLFDLTVFGLLASLGAFGLIITLIELWLMRNAFLAIAPYDALFSTPSRVTPVAMAGVVLVILGLLSLVAYGSTTYDFVTLGFIAVVLIGAGLAVAGFFALAVGVWRMGDRYGEDLFKVGAVLLVLVGIVGMVLILIAARSARRRLVEPSSLPAVG